MKVVIFGTNELSSVAWSALSHDSPHEVIGFTVDSRYMQVTVLHGLPVVPFEQIEKHFPPGAVAMIAPLGTRDVNGLREEKHRAGKAKGYQFISYISSKAVVWPDLIHGENCLIYESAVVQAFVKLGDGVILRAGSLVSHHVEIGDNCFVASGACIGGGARVGKRCFLGLNSTIRDGVTLADRCVIGAGGVLISNSEEDGVYVGVPAKRRPGVSTVVRE
jgi:sugar O-acyltransferase (sialic acid O-acetyltransferase NeuD family)